MKSRLLLLSFCLLSVPAMGQTLAPSPQEMQLQNELVLQKNSIAAQQSLDRQQTSLIEQQQKRQELFSAMPPPVFAPPPIVPLPGVPQPAVPPR
jgi:hypothetical protein